MVSKLCSKVVYTTKKTKRKLPVTKITIHHMAGKSDNPEAVAASHANGSRKVSANYYIGNNGIVVAGVEEEYRAWTSSNAENDHAAITIEVSNDTNKDPWTISAKAYDSLILLCMDICRRYNIIPHYDGTKEATLTVHRMFASTACPGPTIMKLLESGQIERDIRQYTGVMMEPEKPSGQKKSPEEIAREVIQGKWGVGEDRKNRLTGAGYNFREVQKIVNNIMKGVK